MRAAGRIGPPGGGGGTGARLAGAAGGGGASPGDACAAAARLRFMLLCCAETSCRRELRTRTCSWQARIRWLVSDSRPLTTQWWRSERRVRVRRSQEDRA